MLKLIVGILTAEEREYTITQTQQNNLKEEIYEEVKVAPKKISRTTKPECL